MRHLVYFGDKGCKPCREYKERVIDPLIAKHPGSIEVHTGFDARFALANQVAPVTKVPTIIVERGGLEEFRFTAMLEAEQLEEIILCDADVLTASEVLA